MSSHYYAPELDASASTASGLYVGARRWLAPVGRLLFASIFLSSVPNHFGANEIAAAGAAGVPLPAVMVPLAGIIALAGGLSVLLGFRARLGALLLAVFLIPVTLFMHRFWSISDPMESQMQMINFMKNVSLLGTTALIGYFGAGPVSIDERRPRPVATRRESFLDDRPKRTDIGL